MTVCFPCVYKTQPNPTLRHCVAQLSQINTTHPWQGAGAPRLPKQSREAGNQSVPFVRRAANEEPRSSCQHPPGPPQVLVRAGTPRAAAVFCPAAAARAGEVLRNTGLRICAVGQERGNVVVQVERGGSGGRGEKGGLVKARISSLLLTLHGWGLC